MTKLKIFITENHEEDRIPKIDTITKNPITTYLNPDPSLEFVMKA
jgi:hypothetical protein